MAKVDIDALSDEELENYIASVGRKTRKEKTEHIRSGGASRELSLVMVISGLTGVFASLNLVLSEIKINKDPSADLLCDVNALVGCSDFLNARFNTLFFGVPNALYGLMFFSAITAVGVMLLSGSRLATWVWHVLAGAMVAAAVWLLWFQYTAIFVERLLCPYCLITWIATIPLIIHVLIGWFEVDKPFSSRKLGEALAPWRWALVGLSYVFLASVIVATLWDKISTLL